MQLIWRKTIAQTEEGLFTLACFLTGDKKTGYGIKLIEYCNETVRTSCLVENVFRSRSETLELIRLCEEEEVSPVHLPDVVIDFHSRKILQCQTRSEMCTA